MVKPTRNVVTGFAVYIHHHKKWIVCNKLRIHLSITNYISEAPFHTKTKKNIEWTVFYSRIPAYYRSGSSLVLTVVPNLGQQDMASWDNNRVKIAMNAVTSRSFVIFRLSQLCPKKPRFCPKNRSFVPKKLHLSQLFFVILLPYMQV